MFVPISFAQYNDNKFSFGVNAVYTTTAKVYLNPNSSDITLRNQYFLLEDILNPSLDIRYRLTEPLIIGLNVEYMTKTDFGSTLRVFINNTTTTIDVEEGFKLIPIELSLYYQLPFSTESFKFLMGGGGGYYLGEHIRKFGDAEVESIEKKAAFGIHVSLSMEYLLRENIGLRTEMKFRDPQFNLTNKYSKNTVNYHGSTIRLTQEHFDSKINVDGVTFILGAAIYF
ncbi:MAG: hypothetical protein A2V93_07705 [Ignavibacteria bacterium RBG_16_34_14]|nr:MAG: hypothetical protein A2V93_07705 [Ignavibacteria bacterium RBG_16_34_14]